MAPEDNVPAIVMARGLVVQPSAVACRNMKLVTVTQLIPLPNLERGACFDALRLTQGQRDPLTSG